MQRLLYTLLFIPLLLMNYTCFVQKQSFGVVAYAAKFCNIDSTIG